MDFYDQIAQRYDQITHTAARAEAAGGFVRALLERQPVRTALDAACGNGVYSLPLAAAGAEVTAADLSEGMIEQGRRRARRARLAIHWVHSPMQDLGRRLSASFDAVLCMGNSIPHLLEEADLRETLAGFVHLAQRGGAVIVQLLNYARIMARGERIVGIDRAGGRQFVRFYDFLESGLIRFNILQVHWTGGKAEHEIASTTLRPYGVKPLSAALRRAGCRRVEVFSGLDFSPWDERADTVMLVGRK